MKEKRWWKEDEGRKENRWWKADEGRKKGRKVMKEG
jgi:hypothetical protein